jgi:acid phosphatase type 7
MSPSSLILNTSSTARRPAGARFALLGDLGTTVNSNVTIDDILTAHASSPFDAALFAGDLSYADGTQPVWDTFGRIAQPLLSAIPTTFAVGNHEVS